LDTDAFREPVTAVDHYRGVLSGLLEFPGMNACTHPATLSSFSRKMAGWQETGDGFRRRSWRKCWNTACWRTFYSGLKPFLLSVVG